MESNENETDRSNDNNDRNDGNISNSVTIQQKSIDEMNEEELAEYTKEMKKRSRNLSIGLKRNRNNKHYAKNKKLRQTSSKHQEAYNRKLEKQRKKYNSLKMYIRYLKSLTSPDSDQITIIHTYDTAIRLKNFQAKKRSMKKKRIHSQVSESKSGELHENSNIGNENDDTGETEVIEIDDSDDNSKKDESENKSNEDEFTDVDSDDDSFEEVTELRQELELIPSVVQQFSETEIEQFKFDIQDIINNEDQSMLIMINEYTPDQQKKYINYVLGKEEFDELDIQNLSAIETIKKRKSLSKEAYGKFKHFRWDKWCEKKELQNYVCPVCHLDHNNFSSDENKESKMTILSCSANHIVCYDCVRMMAKFQNFCPTCREVLN